MTVVRGHGMLVSNFRNVYVYALLHGRISLCERIFTSLMFVGSERRQKLRGQRHPYIQTPVVGLALRQIEFITKRRERRHESIVEWQVPSEYTFSCGVFLCTAWNGQQKQKLRSPGRAC